MSTSNTTPASVQRPASYRLSGANAESFLDLRHRVLIDVMRLLEGQGAQVAFPTQTVHLIQDKKEAQK